MLTQGRQKLYIAVWSGDEPLTVSAQGQPICIPPIHEVAVAGVKGSRYRFPAAVGKDGRPLPGTVAIHDVYIVKDEATVKQFDAEEWCRTVEENQNDLFKTGFDTTTDPDSVAVIQEQGRIQFEDMQFRRDELIVEHARQQAEHWRKQGKQRPQSTADDAVRAAMGRLNERRKAGKLGSSINPISMDEMDQALGLAPGTTGAATGAVATSAPAPARAVTDLDAAASALMRAVREGNIRLKNEEIQGLIDRDPALMEQVQKKVEAAEAAA